MIGKKQIIVYGKVTKMEEVSINSISFDCCNWGDL